MTRFIPALLCFCTMLAFATNSILNRQAMRDPGNDAGSYAVVRILAGALALAPFLIAGLRRRVPRQGWRDGAAPLLLCAYALCFSLAYRRLDAGSGALLLFGCVQLSMLGVSLARGQRLTAREGLGFGLAASGLLFLFLPGAGQPSLGAAALMGLAGLSWGLYSVAGLGQAEPAYRTAWNFAFGAPLMLLLLPWMPLRLEPSGWALAIISGALSSGLGYVLWYHVLREIKPSSAAIAQLSVPILAGLGGALWLQEWPSWRLPVAGLLVLGGIWLKTRKA